MYPIRCRWDADSRVDLVPHTVAVPLVGSSSPMSSRTVVVLPHPLGPISPTMLPSAMSTVTSRTTSPSPNDLLNPAAETTDPPAARFIRPPSTIVPERAVRRVAGALRRPRPPSAARSGAAVDDSPSSVRQQAPHRSKSPSAAGSRPSGDAPSSPSPTVPVSLLVIVIVIVIVLASGDDIGEDRVDERGDVGSDGAVGAPAGQPIAEPPYVTLELAPGASADPFEVSLQFAGMRSEPAGIPSINAISSSTVDGATARVGAGAAVTGGVAGAAVSAGAPVTVVTAAADVAGP